MRPIFLPMYHGGLPITASLALWYRKGTGQAAGQWDDQSGNARHLTLFNTPTINGDGTITFNGTTQYGKYAAAVAGSLPFTLYVRARQESWASNDQLTDGAADASCAIYQDPGSVSPDMAFWTGTAAVSFTGEAASTWQTMGVAAVSGASATTIFCDSNEATATVNASILLNEFTLCRRGTTNANHGNFRVAEVLVYAAAHDATQRAAVRAYLAGLI